MIFSLASSGFLLWPSMGEMMNWWTLATKRQLICFGGGGLVGVPVYLLTRGAVGGTGAMFLMLGIMLPAFLMALSASQLWTPCPEAGGTFHLVSPHIPAGALRLIKAWGFQYKSVAFVWLKKNRKADSWFYGLGFWTRANAEVCLLATRAAW